jgi:hypothetical protein
MPALFFWFYLSNRQDRTNFANTGSHLRDALANFAIIVVITAVMVTPWCIRNYRVTGQFVYLDTRTGYNLYIGYHEDADGRFNMAAATELARRGIDHVLSDDGRSEVVMHNWGKQQAVEFIKANPGRCLALVPLRIAHFWNLEHNMFLVAYSWDPVGELPVPVLALLMFLLVTPFAFLAIFAVIGVVFAQRIGLRFALLLLVLAYFTALSAAVFGEARLHLPLIPLVAMLAASGLLSITRIKIALSSTDTAIRRTAFRKAVLVLVLVAGLTATWGYGIHYSIPKWQAVFAPGGNKAQLPY